MFYDIFIEPFQTYLFLRRPLVACIALALGCAPIGVLLLLRRMSLMGDAISHAILPGAGLGFLACGLSLTAMSIGGFFAGLLVALSAGLVSHHTVLREDASLCAFYLISLALGVLIVSLKGGNVDLMCVLFGTILSVNPSALIIMATISTLTLGILAVIYRPLLLECYDPGFLRAVGGGGQFYHYTFLFLIILNLVSAFQALGTMMALGIMMLPAIAARFWAQQVWSMAGIAVLFALFSGYGGLVLSYHSGWPSGPSIILIAGVIYSVSLVCGPSGSLLRKLQ